jgi:hypothetical protein
MCDLNVRGAGRRQLKNWGIASHLVHRMPEQPKLDPREQHFRIPESSGLRLFLRYLGPPAACSVSRVVLYVHGATFPSALSIAHRFDGYSWRDHLNAAGFHVWGLDFIG